ncbi:MAG: DUF1211 domain-containing protein [Bacteroidetes bacterium]|nr:DUF1211 domain-containing protein [Bacteroidota bacterium]
MTHSEQTYNQIAGQRVSRLEAISDGVFAIALTLLVLDIKVPVSETIKTESALFDSLCALMPKFLGYFLSFMTLGIFWTGHTTQFIYIDKSDRRLNWICLFFLLFVSVLPFTTAFLSEHIHFKLAIGVYWLNIFLLGVTIYLQWAHAYRHGFLSGSKEAIETANKVIRKRVIIAQTLYGFGALLCFISTYVSIVFIILVQLNYALALFSARRKR